MSRLVTVAEDLDSVTTVGNEDAPGDAGLTDAAVDRLWESVRSWYRLGTAPMLQLCLRRNGFVVLNRAIGHGWGNTPGAAPDAARVLATPDTPSCAFSTAKGVAAAAMFMLVEQGAFRLNDRVCEYIPEFAAHGKTAITIRQVLSHSAGVPFVPRQYHGMALVLDEDLATEALIELRPSWKPDRFRVYHALTGGLILRLLVRRATGKRLREHLAEQVLGPLGFRWNNFGVRPDQVDQVAPSVWTGERASKARVWLARKALGGSMKGAARNSSAPEFLTAELPSGNLITTAFELSRFYEILRRGGELDGVRIMEPGTLREAVAPMRGPGLGKMSVGGYELGGRRAPVGKHTEEWFGRSGLTTQYGWADPARGVSAAILNSGKTDADSRYLRGLLARIAATVPSVAASDRMF
jgi:CubicO group peptidase (beta-lactamase class C family)